MTTPILPDSPEIARLRDAMRWSNPFHAIVQRSDLVYVLARVDESCLGCFVIETVKQQGQTIDRLYAIIDGLMAEKRATPVLGLTAVDVRLSNIINKYCSCGGHGPDDAEACVACRIWHELWPVVGQGIKRENEDQS